MEFWAQEARTGEKWSKNGTFKSGSVDLLWDWSITFIKKCMDKRANDKVNRNRLNSIRSIDHTERSIIPVQDRPIATIDRSIVEPICARKVDFSV